MTQVLCLEGAHDCPQVPPSWHHTPSLVSVGASSFHRSRNRARQASNTLSSEENPEVMSFGIEASLPWVLGQNTFFHMTYLDQQGVIGWK